MTAYSAHWHSRHEARASGMLHHKTLIACCQCNDQMYRLLDSKARAMAAPDSANYSAHYDPADARFVNEAARLGLHGYHICWPMQYQSGKCLRSEMSIEVGTDGWGDVDMRCDFCGDRADEFDNVYMFDAYAVLTDSVDTFVETVLQDGLLVHPVEQGQHLLSPHYPRTRYPCEYCSAPDGGPTHICAELRQTPSYCGVCGYAGCP